MKTSLSGLDLIALSKELQTHIGARLDKVYQPKREEIVISISAKEREKIRLCVKLNGWIWPTKSSVEMPPTPKSFAMQLRKHLSNGTIIDVSQHGCDRIIELVIRKELEYRLIFELFGEGNIVLVANDRIIASMKIKKWRHRELKPRIKYDYPPEAFDPRVVDKAKLLQLTSGSKADIVRTLATRLNLGGGYAEEICKRAHIAKETPAATIDEEQLERIKNAIDELLNDLENKPFPHISYEDDQPVDVSPIKLLTDEGRRVEEFTSFSEAIEKYVPSLPTSEPSEVKIEEEKLRLERTLVAQEAAIEEFSEQIDQMQKLAEFIFTNYEKVEGAIKNARTALKSITPPENVEIIDPATGKFKASIGDEEPILNWKKSVTENAQHYYEEVKKLKAKLEGALEAIEDTKRRTEQLEDEEFVLKAKMQEGQKKSRPAWFERYKWFISSEGVLVIAGKDAKSNEQIVKKHLKPGDRYVHADIHGAPSVIVKAKEDMTEITFEEAGIFSLAMSKAWNAGIAGGSAYWVTPEQVSKRAESGEFIPKGAFIIRGKRNYFEKLELRLGIGVCTFTSKPMIMCGPVSAARKNCQEFVEIVPGDLAKEKAVKELAARFSWDISEVQAILPSGGVKIISEKRD